MTAIATQPACQQTHLTKRAESQLGSLPDDKQRAVCRALAEPAAAWRVEKLTQFKCDGIWRMRIPGNGSVRVVYRVVDDRCIVVFVGEHAAYDRFRRVWKGRINGQSVPFEDSAVVAGILAGRFCEKPGPENGQAPNPQTAAIAEPALTAEPSPLDMLWRGMQSLVRQAVDQELNQNMEVMAKLGREKLEDGLREQSAQLQQQSDVLQGLSRDLTRRGQKTERGVATLQEHFSEVVDAASGEFSDIKSLIRDQQERHAAGVERLDQKLFAATKVVCQRMEERYQATRECLTELTEQNAQARQLLQGYQQQVVMLADLQHACEDRLVAVVDRQVSQLQGLAARWQKSLERRPWWSGGLRTLGDWLQERVGRSRTWLERHCRVPQLHSHR